MKRLQWLFWLGLLVVVFSEYNRTVFDMHTGLDAYMLYAGLGMMLFSREFSKCVVYFVADFTVWYSMGLGTVAAMEAFMVLVCGLLAYLTKDTG